MKQVEADNKTRLSVLLVEDDEVDAGEVKRHLSRVGQSSQYAIKHVRFLREALQHLEQDEPDVVLLDLSLPDADGITNLHRLRQVNPRVPIIVLTGQDDEHLAIEALQHGAQDFIVKGSDGQNSLPRAIRYAIERQELIQQWKKSEQMAAAASEAKSIFLAQMSHEIRTPLTAILGFTELAITPSVSPDCRRSMETVRRNAEHLLEIIDDILDISKIEAGRFEIETMDVHLLDLVTEITSSCRLRAEAKGLEFQLDPHYPLPIRIWTDPTRLKQILFNLIGNAIKFTSNGHVRVSILHDPGQKSIVFKVADSGIGIAPEDQKKLFGLFSQVDASTARNFGGTGLGLAISKRLAEMLGGSIQAESVRGLGSTFTVTIDPGPISETDFINTGEQSESKKSDVSQASNPIFLGRVLVVDDMPDNRELLSYFLRATGLEVGEAANGKIALEMAEQSDWDVVLLDMQMPLIDGRETARLLRARDFDKPIIAVTASAMDSALAGCLDAGCNEYLRKPFKRVDLYRLLAKYLGAEVDRIDQSSAVGAQVPELLREEPGLARPIFSFINNYAGRVEALEQEWRDKNFERMKFLAHGLRGATVFGFPGISRIAELLDDDLAVSTFDRVPRFIEALRAMNRNVLAWKPELERVIATLPPKHS